VQVGCDRATRCGDRGSAGLRAGARLPWRWVAVGVYVGVVVIWVFRVDLPTNPITIFGWLCNTSAPTSG